MSKSHTFDTPPRVLSVFEKVVRSKAYCFRNNKLIKNVLLQGNTPSFLFQENKSMKLPFVLIFFCKWPVNSLNFLAFVLPWSYFHGSVALVVTINL